MSSNLLFLVGYSVKTYGLLAVIPGYVFSALMLLLTLGRNNILIRSKKSEEIQLPEMKPSLQASLMD